jgi:hypothetical protein
MGGWDRWSGTKDFKRISGGSNSSCKKKTMVMCFLCNKKNNPLNPHVLRTEHLRRQFKF